MKIHTLFSSALVAAVAAGFAATAFAGAAPHAVRPLRVMLVAGGCCHNYRVQADSLKKGLEERANVQIDIVLATTNGGTRTVFPEYSNPDWANGYDLVIHDECSADVTDMEYIQRIMAPHAKGLPAVFLHCAMHSFRTEAYDVPGKVTPWYEFTGLQTTGHGAQAPISVTYFDKENPITKGLPDWVTGNEELYNNPMGGIMPTAHAVALGRIGAETSVIAWTNIYKGKARTFATTLGHNDPTVANPQYLDLVARGMLWTVEKLNDTYLKPAAKPEAKQAAAPAEAGETAEPEICACGAGLALAD